MILNIFMEHKSVEMNAKLYNCTAVRSLATETTSMLNSLNVGQQKKNLCMLRKHPYKIGYILKRNLNKLLLRKRSNIPLP